jgi:radical SAM protein with 4Fe4S-binding SPASM domain
MTTARLIDADWIVPAIPELKVIERDGRWLCLNPAVPAWLRTTKPGAFLLQLVDGSRSVRDYHEILAAHDIAVPLSKLAGFFQSAVAAQIFAQPASGSPPDLWEDRKLTAIYLHITNRCNLQCSYCYRESSPHLAVVHDAGRFREMLQYLKPFSIPGMTVTFSGGEPLMHPGFREIVEASSQQGCENLLLTNGTLLTDERIDFIGAHFAMVKISLDGPNEEIHSRTRGKGNFARVLRNIERLARKGIRVAVQVTLSKSGLPHADEVKQALPDLPNVKVLFTPLLPMGRGSELADDYIDNGDFYSFSKGKGAAAYVPGRRNRGCHAGVSSLSIADTGDVYPCHLFHASAFHFGNIFHDRFEDIFFGEKIRSYIRTMDVEHNNPTCRQCEVRFLCGGGCHANTLYSIGSHHGPDSFCSFIKSSIYDSLFRTAGATSPSPA